MTISTPVKTIITGAAIVTVSIAVAAAAGPIAATGVVGQTIVTLCTHRYTIYGGLFLFCSGVYYLCRPQRACLDPDVEEGKVRPESKSAAGSSQSTTSNTGNQAPGRPQALSSSDQNLTRLDSDQLSSSPASEEGPHSPSASGVSPPRSAYSSHSSSPWSPPLSSGYYHSGTSEANYPVDAGIGHIDCTLAFDEFKYKPGSRRTKK